MEGGERDGKYIRLLAYDQSIWFQELNDNEGLRT